jgi:hypothetical protein
MCFHWQVPQPLQDALHANMSGELGWEYKGCTEGEIYEVGQ